MKEIDKKKQLREAQEDAAQKEEAKVAVQPSPKEEHKSQVPPSSEDESAVLRIEISKNQRIDETIEVMRPELKTKFACELFEYVEENIELFAVNQMGQSLPKPLFEAARETTPDRLMKMKCINKFNEFMSRFSNQKDMDALFDIGIPCDLLLDLLRYEDKEILNPSLVV